MKNRTCGTSARRARGPALAAAGLLVLTSGALGQTLLSTNFNCGDLSGWTETTVTGAAASTLWHAECFCALPPAGSGDYTVCSVGQNYVSITGDPTTVTLWTTAAPVAADCGCVPAAGTVGADDASSAAIAMPFAFSLFGSPTATFQVNNNGFVAFDAAVPLGCGFFSNATIPAAAAPNKYAAPFWDDLLMNDPAGSVSYRVSGAPGSQVLTVQWEGMRLWTGTCGAAPLAALSIQASFFEGSDCVEFAYNQTAAATFAATIGLENATGTFGKLVSGPSTASPPCGGIRLCPTPAPPPPPPPYTVAASATPFVTIVGMGETQLVGSVGTATTGCLDDTASPLTSIGFPFTYFCNAVTNFAANANGLLTFGVTSTAFSNQAIPATGTPNNLIATFWDDLWLNSQTQDPSAKVATLLMGAPGSQVRIIEWSHVRNRSAVCPDPDPPLSFQVWLYEGTNNIEMVWDAYAAQVPANTATIGLENSNGTIAVSPAGFTGNANAAFPASSMLYTPSCPPPPPPPPHALPASFGGAAAAYNRGDIGIYNYVLNNGTGSGGSGNQGALQSPLIVPSAGADAISIAFDTVRQVEPAPGLTFDQSFVEAKDSSVAGWSTVLQYTGTPTCSTPATVTATGLALNCLIPGGGNVRFRFNTTDNFSNNYLGWYVDNITVSEATITGLDRYGSGCAGSGGFVPTIESTGGSPNVGNASFSVCVCEGLGGTLAVLFFNPTADVPGTPIGGCNAHLALDALFIAVGSTTLSGSAPGAGSGCAPIPIAADPALVGLVGNFQWALLDAGSGNGVFTVSDALAVTVQP